jgi:hypothetical protein
MGVKYLERKSRNQRTIGFGYLENLKEINKFHERTRKRSNWKQKVGIKEPLVLGIWKTWKKSRGFMKEQAKNRWFSLPPQAPKILKTHQGTNWS